MKCRQRKGEGFVFLRSEKAREHLHKKTQGLPRAAWHPNCSGERNKESFYISLRPCPRRKTRPKGQRQVGDCETGLASSHSYFLEACKLHWAIYSPHVRAFFSVCHTTWTLLCPIIKTIQETSEPALCLKNNITKHVTMLNVTYTYVHYMTMYIHVTIKYIPMTMKYITRQKLNNKLSIV